MPELLKTLNTKNSVPRLNSTAQRFANAKDRIQKVRQADPIGTGKVIANALNVRSGAGQNYERIGGLTKGKTVSVYEEKDGWIKIAYGSTYGWVMKKYTDFVSPNPGVTEPDTPDNPPSTFQVKVTASDGLNLRDIPGNGTTPGNGSTVYECLPYGTILTVTEEKNGWYKVTHGNYTGWICATYTTDYDPNVKTDDIILDVKLKPQQTNYTCGSASGAMCASTYSGKDIAESTIWNYANVNGEGTYVYAVTNAINKALKNNGKGQDYGYAHTSSDEQFFEGAKQSLSKNAPVECQLKPSTLAAFGYSSSGHYVVVSGAYEDNGVKMFRITDPYSGSWSASKPKGQVFDAKVSDIRASIKSHSNYVICHKDASV